MVKTLFKKVKKIEKVAVYTLMFSTINVSWAANQHIRVISEGSCDTEDWSNDAENHITF